MLNSVARVLARTCCFYISYNQNMSLLHITINHTVISVSYMDSKKISKSPAPWNNLTIQSLGFLMGFKKISKSPGPMEQLSIQSLGLLIGFQEDISISISSSISISVKYNNNNNHHPHPCHRHRPRSNTLTTTPETRRTRGMYFIYS